MAAWADIKYQAYISPYYVLNYKCWCMNILKKAKFLQLHILFGFGPCGQISNCCNFRAQKSILLFWLLKKISFWPITIFLPNNSLVLPNDCCNPQKTGVVILINFMTPPPPIFHPSHFEPPLHFLADPPFIWGDINVRKCWRILIFEKNLVFVILPYKMDILVKMVILTNFPNPIIRSQEFASFAYWNYIHSVTHTPPQDSAGFPLVEKMGGRGGGTPKFEKSPHEIFFFTTNIKALSGLNTI